MKYGKDGLMNPCGVMQCDRTVAHLCIELGVVDHESEIRSNSMLEDGD